jgi:hypothetical protein
LRQHSAEPATISAIFVNSAERLPASLLKNTIAPAMAAVMALTTTADTRRTTTSLARWSENHLLMVGASR